MLRHALSNLALTARDFILPPALEPTPPLAQPATEAAVSEGSEVWQHTVRPDESDPTEDTVQAWLDHAVAPVPADGCAHCDLPPGKHNGRQYAALVGLHWWTEPTSFQVNQRRRARDRAQAVT